MKRIVLPLFALLVAALPTGAAAQLHLDLSAGGSLPVGDYAQPPGSNSDFAKPGFTGIAGLSLSLGSNFEWIANGGIASHGLDGSSSAPDGEDIDVGRFQIFPFLTGPRLRIPVGASSALYLEGQAGAARINGPTIGSADFEIQYGSNNTFAYAVGGGFFLGQRIAIGGRFVPLGDVTLDVTLPEVLGFEETLEQEQNISWFDVFLTLRIH